VDAAKELSEFLTGRRAKVSPEQAGLRSYGRRPVPGLRREEVASLAGVSVEYYKRLERGNASGVSDSVLDGLAEALQLDDAERAHLFDLARAASPVPPRRARRAATQKVRPVVQRIIDSITAPATLSNNRADYLTANALGRALYAPLFESPEQPPNSARVHVPGSGRAGVLHRLGEGGKGPRRGPPLRGRPQPARPRADGFGRRAVDAQRAISEMVGSARRALPPDRTQASTPPDRRRPRS
jgi:transcriptional regulator with XRE-family HTH domain